MPSKSVRRKGQKGGFVPTGKTLREARERREMFQIIQNQDLFPDVPEGGPPFQEDLDRRLAALRSEDTQYLQVPRALSSGHQPPDLNLRLQRRGSIGGIKKRKSRRDKKQIKSRRKSKRNKKSRQRKHKKHKKSKVRV